ncbi:hypothetical protein [Methanoculleus methanifontis]|uniref:hypothetical protein n=1 Tax=Methanoculleus methanifontis TaxID=2584086 RepID=UPI002659D610|nr:hypothetical protein [Methanoculleus sp. FWC-SCC3]
MEFASEMIIEAAKVNLRIDEVPITYHARVAPSNLQSFSDGWWHVRFMLLYLVARADTDPPRPRMSFSIIQPPVP